MATENDNAVEEVETPAPAPAPAVAEKTEDRKILKHHSTGMDSSILKFKDINFVVGKGENEKHILQDISGTVKWGHVLAVMGPSGAGKTVLISALTLDALFGKCTGSVTLNDVPITDKIFKRHCYVVKQEDKHWPYLTCRETLSYAAELYEVADKKDIPAVVDEIIKKMGLDVCADTRCARLSGGQRRRLSLGIGLLKSPTLLFLDEPTSGLDEAAASNIMQEIIRVAREERLIILCIIHQPSTRVYNSFDQVMILSKGREAFTGNVKDALPYFEGNGFPCPPATNPAEFFLDLVNSDFSDDAAVDKILDTWQETKEENYRSSHGKVGFGDDDAQTGIVDDVGTSKLNEIAIMFRRHSTLIIRDPILYLGRCAIFLIANILFSIVYWNARDFDQSQAFNKMWLSVWFVAVPNNMGVVAVYVLNDEFKSILRETKNGMVSGFSYVFAKSILTLPIMFVFGVVALGIPAYAIQQYDAGSFGMAILLFACVSYVFEAIAECLSVWFEDPIIGMLQFMNFWFGSFLFGGFLIPLRDMYWPFELFYYIMPYSYYVRSAVYNFFIDESWEVCDNQYSAVCVESPPGTESVDGAEVLEGLGRVIPLFSSDDEIAKDIGIMLAIAAFYKIFYIVGVLYKSSQVSKFE